MVPKPAVPGPDLNLKKKPHPNIGALVIGIVLWGSFYYNQNKEPPKIVLVILEAPIANPLSTTPWIPKNPQLSWRQPFQQGPDGSVEHLGDLAAAWGWRGGSSETFDSEISV